MPSYYFIPKKLVDRWPFLRRTAWWLEAALFRSMVAIVRLLGEDRSTAGLVWLFSRFGPYTGKAAKVNLNLAFVLPNLEEKLRQEIVRDVFSNLGRAMAELVFINDIWQEKSRRLEFLASPETEAMLRGGKPLVMVTAHVGAWQLTNLIGACYGLNVSTVYAEESNPHLADFFRRLRSGFQNRLVPSTGGVRQLLSELRQGNSIGLAIDTRLDGGEMIPLFGVATPTNTVAARLALSNGCPLVPVRATRLEKGRFRISILPPITPPAGVDSREEQALAMTTELNRLFEQWIQEDPSQWMCLKRRWPKGAKPVAEGEAGN